MRSILIATLLLAFSVASAQTDTVKFWKTGGVVSLNFSQVSLQNWAAGGQNSISGNSLINLHANYKKGQISWDNTADLGYGLTKQGTTNLIKSDDRIDLSSKFGKHAFNHWHYTMLLNFKTQFTAGYNYPNDSVRISDFLAPGYGLIAAGFDYKPKDNFTLLIAPLTGKFTIVRDQNLANAGAYGVDKAMYDESGAMVKEGDNLRKELGGYIKVQYTLKVMENVTLQTKGEVFSNYLKNPQNLDVNAEMLLSMKVNKYISLTLLGHLIYDDDIRIPVDTDDDGIPDQAGPRTQFKEVLGVGFTYKF